MNGCRQSYSIAQLFNLGNADPNRLRGNRPIIHIPYIGPGFQNSLNQAGYTTVDDIVRAFTGYPPLTQNQIRQKISQMFRNNRRQSCTENVVDNYHVSDTNQCAYNSVLELLRFAHQNQNQWQPLRFSVRPNIPQSLNLNFRERGENMSVRHCACHNNEDDCRNTLPHIRCRWTPPNATHQGACTPRGLNQQEGFKGDRERTNQDSTFIANSPQLQLIDGLPYVRRYRILDGNELPYQVPNAPLRGRIARGRIPDEYLSIGQRRRRRRERARGSGSRRQTRSGRRYGLRGGGLHDIKKRILMQETRLGKKIVTLRRNFNHLLQSGTR